MRKALRIICNGQETPFVVIPNAGEEDLVRRRLQNIRFDELPTDSLETALSDAVYGIGTVCLLENFGVR